MPKAKYVLSEGLLLDAVYQSTNKKPRFGAIMLVGALVGGREMTRPSQAHGRDAFAMLSYVSVLN